MVKSRFKKEDWDQSKYLPPRYTILSEAEGAYALREAWKKAHGAYPSNDTLGCIWAQSVLESGRYKKMHNYSFGHIKSRPTDGRYWTGFECGEIFNGKQYMYPGTDPMCFFRAYKSSTEGALDYILFLKGKRYTKSLIALKEGDVRKYTVELSKAGYFTAFLDVYMNAMVRLFSEFKRKEDKLLSYKPEDVVKLEEIEEVVEEMELLTQEEKNKIANLVSESINDSVYEIYLQRKDDVDVLDQISHEPSFWQKLKGRLGFK